MGGIAIYERDDLMYELLREWLTGAGYAVRDLPRGFDALDPDLAIVSVSGPRFESEILIRGVQQLYPGTPIIALSSQARAGLCSAGAAARALGVERVMAKPLGRCDLLAAVETVIGPPPRP